MLLSSRIPILSSHTLHSFLLLGTLTNFVGCIEQLPDPSNQNRPSAPPVSMSCLDDSNDPECIQPTPNEPADPIEDCTLLEEEGCIPDTPSEPEPNDCLSDVEFTPWVDCPEGTEYISIGYCNDFEIAEADCFELDYHDGCNNVPIICQRIIPDPEVCDDLDNDEDGVVDEELECSRREIAETLYSCDDETEIASTSRRHMYCGYEYTYMEQSCEEWAGTSISSELCRSINDTLCGEPLTGSCRLRTAYHDGEELHAPYIPNQLCEAIEDTMHIEDICADIGLAYIEDCYDHSINKHGQEKALPPLFNYDRCIEVQYCTESNSVRYSHIGGCGAVTQTED